MNSILLVKVNISDIGNNILTWVEEKAQVLITLLPTSPFRKAIDLIESIPYMNYIKWFVPIDAAILILMWWGTAITVYYAYMVILRWIKAID